MRTRVPSRTKLLSAGMRSGVSLAMRRVAARAGDGGGGAAQELQGRGISVLRGAVELNWRDYVPPSVARLGGTLVVSDSEHKGLVQQAHREGNLSFGFSAGGTLFPYYIGTMGALTDAGVITDEVKVAGASAGSLIAACSKSGMPLEEITEQCLGLMADCREHGTRGRLGAVLERFLRERLPEDAHERCEGRAFVAVTQARPYLRPKLLSSFHSRDDLIRALLTSCHIPLYLDGNVFTEFRGEPHMDGGLSNFIPLAPATVGVRVCCFPARQLSPVYRIGIAPDAYEPWPYSLRQMVQWALEPADEDIVAYLIDKGKRDAQAWMEDMGLHAESSRAEQRANEEGVLAAAAAATGSSETRAGQQQRGAQALRERGEAARDDATGSAA